MLRDVFFCETMKRHRWLLSQVNWSSAAFHSQISAGYNWDILSRAIYEQDNYRFVAKHLMATLAHSSIPINVRFRCSNLYEFDMLNTLLGLHVVHILSNWLYRLDIIICNWVVHLVDCFWWTFPLIRTERHCWKFHGQTLLNEIQQPEMIIVRNMN